MAKKKITEEDSLIYQKAQDSAEHYNTMIWTLTSVLLAFSITILYLVSTNNYAILLNIILLLFGFFSLFYFSTLIELANETKCHNYDICKKIETEYGLRKNHSLVDKLPIHKELKKRGMKLLRIAKKVLYLLYLFAIIRVQFGWSLDVEYSFIVSLILFTAVSIGLYMEFLFSKYSPKENERIK